MPESAPVIVWFRQDLRLADNPALHAAAELGRPVLPVFILDDDNAAEWKYGAASRWWLHQSLAKLDASLRNALLFTRGDARTILPELTNEIGAYGVFWNRCVEPWRVARDASIKEALLHDSVVVRTFNGSLLFDPANTTKPDGTPYKVFTPFYRKGCLQNGVPPRRPLPAPGSIPLYPAEKRLSLDALELMPHIDWYRDMAGLWSPGEQGAIERLQSFLGSGIDNYETGRNRPDQQYVSRLSPHLHFGEISPNQVWHAVRGNAAADELCSDADRFLSELGWREFSANLLFHEPAMTHRNLQRKFDRFPCSDGSGAKRATLLSMPACASCGRAATCTIGCA